MANGLIVIKKCLLMEIINLVINMDMNIGNRDWAERKGMTQKEFNDMMNNPNIYQIEEPISNMSHQFEAPDDIFFGGK
jgi:hypothetical protein